MAVDPGERPLSVPLQIEAPLREAEGVSACFHCGQPAHGSAARSASVGGGWRRFCCPGCEAVATAIHEQGMADYYRLREALPQPLADDAPPGDLPLYDDATFQRSFVTDGPDGTREAALLLEGIRCSACVWLIEETLSRQPGVCAVQVNYVTRRARVRWAPGAVRLSAILARVAAVGYRVHPYVADRAEALRRSEHRAWLWRVFVAGFGMMQVMMYALPAYLAEDGSMTADIERLMRWASLVLTAPVVGYSALPFFRGAWRDLRARRLGMDVPVALGVAIAFGASVWATLRGTGEVYFDSVTMFVFLLLAGRFLELLARERAGDALTHLSRLQPAFAARLIDFPASHASERVTAATLAAGELILVKPGEVVPADGALVEGRGEVNEALLTGESRPVAKSQGDPLIGGSTNMGSALVMRVSRVAADSMLAAITRLVDRAAAERQPLAELADRYAHWFVLVVLVVAAATAAAWWWIDPSRALWVVVSVLVATCPCALSLAVPAALTAATGTLARRGFVATRGHAIETLARATDFVFDKTGTLTEGAPRVVALEVFGALGERQCATLAATMEQASEHPLARAIIAYADAQCDRPQPATDLVNEAGAGIQAYIGGRTYRLGAREYCTALCGVHSAVVASSDAHTEVWLASEDELLARFALADTPKPDARALIDALQAMGKTVHLVSGDSAGPVAAVAAQLGIACHIAQARPEAKLAYVRELQRRGAVVAMVGDGVNDAPVLAQADVSIAMGSGAHLAQVRADAVLLSSRPRDLLVAISFARRTLMVIRQNLAWAFGYNLLVIPAAAAGWVSPWLAGLGMSASSLAVVLNALRLRIERRA